MKKLKYLIIALALIPSALFAYTVQQGDTPYELWGTNWKTELSKYGIQDPRRLPVGLEVDLEDDLFGAVILPEDSYDTFLTAPLSTSATEVFVNVTPSFVSSSIYTIFASDGRTVREKVYCTGTSASPNKLTGCVRGLSEGPVSGVIDETAGTGVSHSRNARIAITDNINFSGKALAILGGNQETGSDTFRIGVTTNTDKYLIFDTGTTTNTPRIHYDATNNQLKFRRYGETSETEIPLSLRGTYADYASLPTDASNGDIAITDDDHKLYVYDADGTTWVLSGGSSGAGTVYRTIKLGSEADGGDNMTFSLTAGSWPDSKFLQVFLNGVYMREGASYDYTVTDSDTIVFNYTVADSDTIGMYVVSVDLYNANWSQVSEDLLPDLDATHDIGSSTKQFKDAYFSGTVYGTIGEATSTPTADKIVMASSSGKILYDWLFPTSATGTILYFDGTSYVNLGIGTAGQVLNTNSGATAPQWGTPNNKIITGTETRADNTAGSAVAYTHNLGVLPSYIKIWGHANRATGNDAESYGVYNVASGTQRAYTRKLADNWTTSTSYIIPLSDGSYGVNASITAVSTSTFTITWLTTPNVSSEIQIFWEVGN